MIVGLKVIIPTSLKGINKEGEEATVEYLCEDGKRVFLSTGYFHQISDLKFIDSKDFDDPELFAKCIKKHGSLIKALKKSLK